MQLPARIPPFYEGASGPPWKGGIFLTKTKRLQLNQWVPEDRILRQDFNRDNAALDAAFLALEAQVQPTLIREIITSADADTVDLDVSDIDWTQWSRLIIDSHAVTRSGENPIHLTVYSGITGRQLGRVRSTGEAETEDEGTSRLILLAGYEPQRRISTVSISLGVDFYETTYYRLRELQTISVTHATNGGYAIAAGSKFRILGVK